MTRRGWALFATMSVLWGIPYLLIKVAVRDVTPGTLVFLRTSVGAALLLPFALRRNRLRPLLPHWRILLAYTVAEIAIPWWLLSDAERRLSSSLSGLLVAAVPLAGAVLARLTGGERLHPRRLAGLAVGLAGVAALLGFDVGHSQLPAVGEVALVAVGYATGPLLIAGRLSRLPSIGVVTASLVVCAVVYAPFAAVQWPATAPPPHVIAAIGTLAVLCTAAAFLLFFLLVAEIGPVRSTVITYVNPAVAVVLGVVLLHERFTVGTAIGFVLILTGCYLATRPVPADRRTVPPTAAAGAGLRGAPVPRP